MTIESILSKDFSALVRKFDADAFTENMLGKLKGVERLRLIAVGSAGAAGAAIAASQFEALVSALTESFPMLTSLTVADNSVTFDMGAAPMVMTALLFALVGGATAMIVPGSR